MPRPARHAARNLSVSMGRAWIEASKPGRRGTVALAVYVNRIAPGSNVPKFVTENANGQQIRQRKRIPLSAPILPVIIPSILPTITPPRNIVRCHASMLWMQRSDIHQEPARPAANSSRLPMARRAAPASIVPVNAVMPHAAAIHRGHAITAAPSTSP